MSAEAPQMRRMLALAWRYRVRLLLGVGALVVSQGTALVFPLVIKQLVDGAFGEVETTVASLDRIALLLLGVFTVQAIFHGVRVYCLSTLGEAVVADLRKRVYEHLMTLPVRFFADKRVGELTSRLITDVAVLQTTLSASLGTTVAQTIALLGGSALAVKTSASLALSVAAFLPAAVVAAMWIGRRVRRASTAVHDQVAEAAATAAEAMSAKPIVQWFNAEAQQVARYAASVDAAHRVALRRAWLQAVMRPVVVLISYGTLAFVLWRGGRLVHQQLLSPGDLVAFLLYTGIVAASIVAFTGVYAQLQMALGASRRLFDLLDQGSELEDPPRPVELAAVEGRVTFAGVRFRYPGRDVDVLDGIDLEVAPGEAVALVGPSGAGKSTLVALLPRFYDPSAGRILLDGVDLRAMRQRDVRAHMAAVPQDIYLFSGTLADNLRMGKPDATAEELRRAAVAANAHDFIEAFPRGYETLVGERGIKLSGGQRQRVAIARALLKDPRILVLDEATSSLDAESEALVQEALEALMRGRTTLVVAHRLSTVRNADRIVVLDRGRIVQQGPHADLIAGRGLYADLYATQFEGT